VVLVSPPSEYLERLAARLAQDGCQPHWEEWTGTRVLIGHRADFRVQWMATRLHLWTIATAVPEVAAVTVSQFATTTMAYADGQKRGLPPGIQNGIAVFPCLVSERVHPDALARAESKQVSEFAIMARPVVVDVARGVIGSYRRTGFIGGMYGPYLRRKIQLYFDGALAATPQP
jgi:hypothetical protein